MIEYRERFNSWKPAGFDGEFDWDFILPAFKGTKIKPMDIDAMVERKGKFLAFETKIPGKDIPVGQAITLNALLATGAVSVFFLEGKSYDVISAATFCYPSSTILSSRRIECDFRYVIAKTRAWLEWANGAPFDNDPFWRGFDDWIVDHFENSQAPQAVTKGASPSPRGI